jgi:hypothetical protein
MVVMPSPSAPTAQKLPVLPLGGVGDAPCSPVELTPLTSGKWGATRGGCVTYSHAIVAETAADAWAQLEALGWTAYQYGPNTRVYAKCPKCSVKPAVATPKRPRRYR